MAHYCRCYSTWGLTVVGVRTESKRKTKPTEFRLVNADIGMGIFNHPAIKTALMFGEYTPVLGDIRDGDEDLSEDEDEVQTIDMGDDSEHTLAFLHMLVSKQV